MYMHGIPYIRRHLFLLCYLKADVFLKKSSYLRSLGIPCLLHNLEKNFVNNKFLCKKENEDWEYRGRYYVVILITSYLAQLTTLLLKRCSLS